MGSFFFSNCIVHENIWHALHLNHPNLSLSRKNWVPAEVFKSGGQSKRANIYESWQINNAHAPGNVFYFCVKVLLTKYSVSGVDM